MAQVKAEKQYNNFTKGLITEASPLTFPENSALDLNNLILERSGKLSRRLGVNFETNYSLISTGISDSVLASSRQSFHKWETPSGSSNVSIGIIRIYNKLWFVDLLSDSPSSSLLNGGIPLAIPGLGDSLVDMATVNNHLILVSSDLEQPLLLVYNKTTALVEVEIVPIQVRDFWGVVDSLPIDKRTPDLTATHNYNLINQGWSPAITSICPGTPSVDTVKSVMAWVQIKNSVDYLTAISNGTYTNSGTGMYGWVKTGTIIEHTAAIVSNAIACTKTTIGVYPSNSDVWTLGKVEDTASTNFEKYDPNVLKKNSIYGAEAPKGAFVLDAFDRGETRRALTGLTSLPLDKENGRISTVTSFGGRVFYAGVNSDVTTPDDRSPNYSSVVFFSQQARSKEGVGKCYQDADPTSPTISDLLPTDGGIIQIPDITKIYKLLATRVSILVFAQNGVWEIFGDTGGFTATSYQVSKISSVGTESPGSVVDASQGIIYWSKAGIYVLTQNDVSGRYQAENISLSTIQTYYNKITDLAKQNVRGYFEESQNRVRWLFNDTLEYSNISYINKYNKELVLDLTLGSFYPNEFNVQSGGPFISDYAEIPKFVRTSALSNVLVGIDQVRVGIDDVLVSITTGVGNRIVNFKFLAMHSTQWTLADYNSEVFRDWVSGDGTGYNYSSYIVTGFELYGDMLRKKQVPYLLMSFERTESGYTQDGQGLQFLTPSSCVVQAQWNWANSAAGGKWGTPFQAYRFSRMYMPANISDPFDNGDSVINSKSKLRGSGKCLSLKIVSEEGKDMRILGWGTTMTGGSVV